MLKVKKLHKDAIIPKYQTAGAACFDISTNNDFEVYLGQDAKTFPTGLSFEVPENHVMLVFSRSGHGFKNDIRLANCVGVIDSDYRGELKVKLTNDTMNDYVVAPFERIAQAMILPVKQFEILEVEELTETERGNGGLGSTGK